VVDTAEADTAEADTAEADTAVLVPDAAPDAEPDVAPDSASPDTAPCTSALVGHWAFDESSGLIAADSSCYGGHGELKGFGTPVWSAGRRGNALTLAPTGWVRIANSPAVNAPIIANRMTVAAWLYPTVATNTGIAVARQSGTANLDSFYLSANTSGRIAFGLSNNLPGTPTNCSDSQSAPLNQWTHAAATFDGTVVRLYKNGTQICSFTRAVTMSAETTPVTIGANIDTVAETAKFLFQGRLDDVVLYSRALSPTEITALGAGNPPPSQ
jgi:hypothetical protein